MLLEREFKSFLLVIGQDTSCQSNFTVRAIARAHLNGLFFTASKKRAEYLIFFILNLVSMINW